MAGTNEKQEKASAFLKNHGMNAEDIDPASVLKDFQTEMEQSLAGRKSSLAMIPTYITANKNVPPNQPVIVMDIGGTNLRVGVVTFNESGKAEMGDFTKYGMPGIEKELGRNEFFNQFAEYIMPVVDRADRIGLCFSYPAEISPDRDGRLMYWTKEVKAPEVVGQFIGKGILAALGEKGKRKKATLLNDTIATLLAGKSAGGGEHDSYIGFILGTGTNTAYEERNSNITKLADLDQAGSQAINVESGNFDKVPRSDIDGILDQTTTNPGRQTFEKMISGLYLGTLGLFTLKQASGEGIFSGGCSALINSIDDLTIKTIDAFLAGSGQGPLAGDMITADDRELMATLFGGVIARSAKLAAINISAAVIKSGAGKDPGRPVCVNIDGATYYKTTNFKPTIEKHLHNILGSRGISYELVHVDEAPIIGAAVAGLTHS